MAVAGGEAALGSGAAGALDIGTEVALAVGNGVALAVGTEAALAVGTEAALAGGTEAAPSTGAEAALGIAVAGDSIRGAEASRALSAYGSGSSIGADGSRSSSQLSCSAKRAHGSGSRLVMAPASSSPGQPLLVSRLRSPRPVLAVVLRAAMEPVYAAAANRRAWREP